MGKFDHNDDHHNDYKSVSDAQHKAKLSHQVIAGAAAYEAAKAYNDHCEKNGNPNNHAKAMEIFAGLSGVIIDRLVETKGLDYLDKKKAQKEAEDYAKSHFDKHY
ncbi:hypothetical protein F5887DRAFT_328499 [Amanita rubescens]|nr:hypothetical protein F5887DRAFT_328499 [Amanita rubescens]